MNEKKENEYKRIIQTKASELHNSMLVAGNTKANQNFFVSNSWLNMRNILVSFLRERKKINRRKNLSTHWLFCSFSKRKLIITQDQMLDGC